MFYVLFPGMDPTREV